MRLASRPWTPPTAALTTAEPVLGLRDLTHADLLPRLVRHHQEYPVQLEGVTAPTRSHQMTHMDRVERPAKHPDPLHLQSLEGHSSSSRRTYRVRPEVRSYAVGMARASWTPQSWRLLPAAQQPPWPDENELERALKELGTLPPLVFAGEARSLTNALGEVAQGRAFLLQAGDCSESFAELSANSIRDKLKIILQMAVMLTYAAGVPIVKVGRMAGQFAKPRSSATELVGETELDSFRGHMVNDEAPYPEARVPDPSRLIAAYHHSASTLNLLPRFTKGGFADLSQVHLWNQQFVASSEAGRRYEQIAA